MNHVDMAVGLIRYINEWQEEAEDTPETNLASAMLAQVHATLALAEQQRIANLIALVGQGVGSYGRAEAVTALIRYELPPTLRPEIAEALGIKGDEK